MAKKAVKKTVHKKAAKKKKISKKKATPKLKSKVLKDAPDDGYFILCNGQPIRNLLELADMVEELRDDIFYHHVTPDKNDFAAWIEGVFKDKELSKQLADIKDKGTTRVIIYRHIIKKLQ